jgi:hypothetical protein
MSEASSRILRVSFLVLPEEPSRLVMIPFLALVRKDLQLFFNDRKGLRFRRGDANSLEDEGITIGTTPFGEAQGARHGRQAVCPFYLIRFRIEPTMPPTTPPCAASLCCVGMYSMTWCAGWNGQRLQPDCPRSSERCENDSVTAKNHGRNLKGNARLERADVSRMHPQTFPRLQILHCQLTQKFDPCGPVRWCAAAGSRGVAHKNPCR